MPQELDHFQSTGPSVSRDCSVIGKKWRVQPVMIYLTPEKEQRM